MTRKAAPKKRKPSTKPTVPTGNAESEGDTCTCGHSVEEHGNDPDYPGSTACSECDGDCIAYEANQ